jgi:hypothetical protein
MLGAATVIAVGMAVLAPGTAAADCAPAVAVDGDPESAAAVTAALATLGISDAEAEGGCAVVAATVSRAEAGLIVVITVDARSETRVVAEAATAATWIESWIRDDDAPLWRVPLPATSRPTPSPIVEAVLAPSDVAAKAPPALGATLVPEAAVGVVRDFASDGSAWDGFTVAACARFGRWCFGASGRRVATHTVIAIDPDDGLGSAIAIDRGAAVLAATVSVSGQLDRLTLAPTVAVGVGRATAIASHPDGGCEDECMVRFVDGDEPVVGLRLAAGIAASVPITGWLAIDGELGAELAPSARGDRRYRAEGPDRSVVDMGPLLELPADPAWVMTARLALRAWMR